jgi:XTP/dITP diphosphohydrolase
LIRQKAIRKTEKMMAKVGSNPVIVILYLHLTQHKNNQRVAMNTKAQAFMRLVRIMDDLREKCPWDRKQTIHTLRKLTIEEMYELIDAILEEDYPGIEEEIGDIFLHLVFYAKIGEEKKAFTLEGALNGICEKLIKRHPHIYGDATVTTDEEVKKNWEAIKLAEGKKSVLQGVPNALPAMVKAYRLQEKTATVGFEWDKLEDVWAKVEEEQEELKEAVASGDQEHIEEEFGDLLFSMINYGRFLKVDPEAALEKINKKFKRRFEYIEAKATKGLDEMSLEEMDALWEESKGRL